VLATASRVYVTCLGAFGGGAEPWESLVVVDPATNTVLKSTTFPRCDESAVATGPSGCKTAVPGRMAVRNNQLLIGDSNSGRLLVTDLDGNPIGDPITLCPLKCSSADPSTEVCYQFVSDVAAL